MRKVFAAMLSFAVLATACGPEIQDAQRCVDTAPPGQVVDVQRTLETRSCHYKAAPAGQPASTPRPAAATPPSTPVPAATPAAPAAATPAPAPAATSTPSGFRTPVYETQPSSVQGSRSHRGLNVWKGRQLPNDTFNIPAGSWLVAQGDARGNGTCVIMVWKTGNPVKPSEATYHVYVVSAPTEQGMTDEVSVIQAIAAREVDPNGDPAKCPVVAGPTR